MLAESARVADERQVLGDERSQLEAERAALDAEVTAFKETQSKFEAACEEFERLYHEFEDDREHLADRAAELREWHAVVEKVRATLAEEQASLKNDRLALLEDLRKLKEERAAQTPTAPASADALTSGSLGTRLRRTLAVRLPTIFVLFILGGVLLALARAGSDGYRNIAGACLSLGLIALLDLFRFAGNALLEPSKPPAVDAFPDISAPDPSDSNESADPV